MPASYADVAPVIRQMVSRGELQPVDRAPNLYLVQLPYSDLLLADERELLLEAHPYATLAYLSAFAFHGLTNLFPRTFTLMAPRTGFAGLVPIGTSTSEWEAIADDGGDPDVLPTPRYLDSVGRISVEWTRVRPERYIGLGVYETVGSPLRVTALERTLLDGLQEPEKCGGFENVVQAWSAARDRFSRDQLVDLVERLDVAILRQRVGYVLEGLGISLPIFERWRERAKRGGSSRLVGSAPFQSTYSERWNLSINAPVDGLLPVP